MVSIFYHLKPISTAEGLVNIKVPQIMECLNQVKTISAPATGLFSSPHRLSGCCIHIRYRTSQPL